MFPSSFPGRTGWCRGWQTCFPSRQTSFELLPCHLWLWLSMCSYPLRFPPGTLLSSRDSSFLQGLSSRDLSFLHQLLVVCVDAHYTSLMQVRLPLSILGHQPKQICPNYDWKFCMSILIEIVNDYWYGFVIWISQIQLFCNPFLFPYFVEFEPWILQLLESCK